MARALDILEQFRASSDEGGQHLLELLPPLDDENLSRLERQIPCVLPADARELFRYARGFRTRRPVLHRAHCCLSDVDLSGIDAQIGLEDIFPHAQSIAEDGCGNCWVVDLTSGSASWGPIFYACHDPAVVVYQAHDVAGFIEDVFSAGNKLDAIQEAAGKIWSNNPGILTYEECANSSDGDLRNFAESLDPSYQIIDMRLPVIGEGFSWGRYGASTEITRFGDKRIFAYQKKTRWQRARDYLWRRS